MAKPKLGTFTVGSNAVTLTRGRGKNKAVVLNVSFKDLEVWAAKNGLDEKKLWKKSYGRACSGLKAKFKLIISHGGGCEGVPKFTDFESFTKELRAAEGNNQPMGGRLADKRRIVAFKRGKAQIIGWPDGMKTLAENFQEGKGGDGYDDKMLRRYWYSLGVSYVPKEYVHNPRRILPEPFGSYVEKYLDEWAEKSFYKELGKQMAIKRHI